MSLPGTRRSGLPRAFRRSTARSCRTRSARTHLPLISPDLGASQPPALKAPVLPAAIAVAAFAVLRWRDFGPAGTARPAPRKRHPPVGPGTGRDIDPFLSNAAAWLSAHRPSVITFEECLIIWALPELGHTTYACKTNPARPERANRASPAGSSQWNGITQIGRTSVPPERHHDGKTEPAVGRNTIRSSRTTRGPPTGLVG